MVRIGTVWDRATDVLRGRAAIMTPIAALAIWLPAVVSNAVGAYVQPTAGAAPSPATGLLVAVVTIAVLVLSIWGQLALLAIASHPATTRADATRAATARLLPALGVVLAIVLLFVLLVLPVLVALAAAGVDFQSESSMQTLPAGTGAFVGLYSLVLVPVAIWFSARVMLLNPVVLNERRGLGAIRRSFQLTRGLTWKIVGVLLLFGVVILVALLATQGVASIVFRLILGADQRATVTFLAASIGAIVTTAMSVVAAAFTAQLYVAAVADKDAATLN